MAALALHALGADDDEIATYLAVYQERLSPRRPGDLPRGATVQSDTYAAYVDAYDDAIAQDGWESLLHRELPALLSGWVRDAYHPVIRLGYGVRFDVPSEIAAGLAYLRGIGPDPAVEGLAKGPSSPLAGFFNRLGGAHLDLPAGRFNSKIAAVIEQDGAQRVADEPRAYARITRRALDVFHATHNFFALHLVTASHAFRTLAPFAGEHALGLFSAGIAVGYQAIGAPEAPRSPHNAPSAFDWRQLRQPRGLYDDHDLKLLDGCVVLAVEDDDPAYLAVARRYLKL